MGRSEVITAGREGERVEGRRWSEVGDWPVWKVLRWRRRWPERDFGSRGRVSGGVGGAGRGGGLAFGVVFEDVDVAGCVGADDVELAVVGEELGGVNLHAGAGFAKEREFVGFLLVKDQRVGAV